MDLTINAKQVQITGYDYKHITLELSDIKESELNTTEVAKVIDFDVYFDAHSEQELLQYVKANYDWFDNLL